MEKTIVATVPSERRLVLRSVPSRLLAAPRAVLYLAGALFVLGLVLFGVLASKYRSERWRLLDVPIEITEGNSVRGTFHVDRPATVEVAIDFETRIPRARLASIAVVVDKPSPLDVTWSVSAGAEMLANGNCRDYVYVRSAHGGSLRHLARKLLGNPLFNRAPGMMERGVGSVACEPGVEYTFEAEVGASLPTLKPTHPHLSVLMPRRDWDRHERALGSLRRWGLLSLAGGGALVAYWVAARLMRRLLFVEEALPDTNL